jgi:putative ABC transport system permease protein
VSSFGLDAQSVDLDGARTAVSLPLLDRTGVMTDFATMLRAARAGLGGSIQLEVFVSDAAPADLVARLARLGVTVTRTVHASTFLDQLDHTGPAFADGLFLVAAGAAVLLAIGATVLAGVTTSRRRAYELAALEAVGVRARTLRRSAALEQAILLAAGLVVGLAAGIVGALLALPSTPVFIDQTIGPPIDHGLPYGLLVILVVVLIVVFGSTSVVIARFVAHQASAGRLREAQA